MFIAAVAAFALSATAFPEAAPAYVQAEGAPSAEREAHVDRVANALLPPQLLTQMVVSGIDVVFRERVGRDARFVELEAAHPGISDALMAGALEEARRTAPAAAAAAHAEVRAFWQDRLTPAELRSFAAALSHPRYARLATRGFRVAPGETVTTALERHFADAGYRPDHPEFAAFAATPAGRRVGAVMAEFEALSRASLEPRFLAAVRGVLDAGYRAANAHARSLGHEPPFAE